MWKEVPRTRKKEVLSSHHVESSRPSLTTVSLEVQFTVPSTSHTVYSANYLTYTVYSALYLTHIEFTCSVHYLTYSLH